jgi:hypothetical protein
MAVFVASISPGGTCWAPAAREAKSGAPPGKVEGGASHGFFSAVISRDGRGLGDGDAAMLKIRCEQDFFMDLVLSPKMLDFWVKKLMEMGHVA